MILERIKFAKQSVNKPWLKALGNYIYKGQIFFMVTRYANPKTASYKYYKLRDHS